MYGNSHTRRGFLPVFLLACSLVPIPANAATTIIVAGTSNIFGAGLAALPAIPDTQFNRDHANQAGAGTAPASFSFAPDPYLVLHFDSITGGVGYNDTAGTTSGDGFSDQRYGGNLISTNVRSTAGLSGLSKTNRVLFLVGVFLGPTLPTTAPAAVNYNGADDQLNFRPAIGQTFFIGNGITTAGLTQNFYVPQDATTLYLGFADGWLFQGSPSWYGDNNGALSATLSMDTYTTPDPATAWLVIAPLAGLWYRSRRRRVV